jgi:adenylate kinase
MAGERLKSVLLFGAPGAGKGTQGKILGSTPGFYHLSCGDVFRSIDMHSEIGKIFCEFSARGELVPDAVTVQLWRSNMRHTALSNFHPKKDLLVLDGIPRNVEQASFLDTDIEVLKIIHLVCDDKDKMVERLRKRALKDNRADDAREDVILHRWEIYEKETQPVLAHYPADIIVEVNATQTPPAVLVEILTALLPVYDSIFETEDA